MSARYTGPCYGGPMDGQTGESRFPAGFVLVDRPSGRAWIYDRSGSQFNVRDAKGMPLDDEKRWEAANGAKWDVRAL